MIPLIRWIASEGAAEAIGPSSRFKCDMRFTVPFENDVLRHVVNGMLRESDDALEVANAILGVFGPIYICDGLETDSIADLWALTGSELSYDAAYISWYGRVGTP